MVTTTTIAQAKSYGPTRRKSLLERGHVALLAGCSVPKRQTPLPPAYEPNPLLRIAFDKLFANIEVDKSWLPQQTALAADATVVHVLQSLNFVEFLALDHVTKQHSLPRIRFVSDLGLWVLNPMGKGWLNALRPKRHKDSSLELERVITSGGSVAFFLKRRANVVELATSGARWLSTELKEGDRLVRALLRLQRESSRPIVVVPELFFWTKQPVRDGVRARDLLLGPPESPSASWAVAHLLASAGSVRLSAAEPLNLAEFLQHNADLPEEALVRRLIYAIMRRFSRERRTVIGPTVKAPERIRADIVRSPRVRELINDLSGGDPTQADILRRRTLEMLEQLQAKPDHHTMRALGKGVQILFNRIYSGLDVDPNDIERLRAATREGTLIYLPSHKSHVDYLAMSHELQTLGLPIPMIAAGDNLDFFPMGPLFRRSGAFFIRRSFKGDRLYAAIVDAYVRRLIRDGFPLELYLEGGRSRTGKLLPPKLGLLSMIVEATLAESQKKTFFVPVSIGYERIIETDSYHRELTGGDKSKEDAFGLLKSRSVLKHRYGRINLQFGQFVTLEQLRTELGVTPGEALKPAKRRAVVSRLATRVLDEINHVTAVTPGALTALALLSHSHRGLGHEEVVARAERLLMLLCRDGARLTAATATPSGTLRPEAIREALQLFCDGDLVHVHATATDTRRERPTAGPGAIYTVSDDKRLALDTSKNIIIHFFVERSILALSLLVLTGPDATEQAVANRFQEIATLLQFEFRLPTGDGIAVAFTRTLDEFIELNILQRTSTGGLHPGAGCHDSTTVQWLTMLGAILVNYIEGYRVTARALSTVVEGSLPEKDFIKKALYLGQQMYFSAELTRPEATSKPIVQNALQAFAASGLVSLQGGNVGLTENNRNTQAVERLETNLHTLLRGATW
jgi:glycerol-3-phosphate O-acyltransferase